MPMSRSIAINPSSLSMRQRNVDDNRITVHLGTARLGDVSSGSVDR
jgi:hypothetical protein